MEEKLPCWALYIGDLEGKAYGKRKQKMPCDVTVDSTNKMSSTDPHKPKYFVTKLHKARVTSPKGAKTRIFNICSPVYLDFPSFFAGTRAWARGPGPGLGPGPAKKDGKCVFFFQTGLRAVGSLCKGLKKTIFRSFFDIFWPAGRPR